MMRIVAILLIVFATALHGVPGGAFAAAAPHEAVAIDIEPRGGAPESDAMATDAMPCCPDEMAEAPSPSPCSSSSCPALLPAAKPGLMPVRQRHQTVAGGVPPSVTTTPVFRPPIL